MRRNGRSKNEGNGREHVGFDVTRRFQVVLRCHQRSDDSARHEKQFITNRDSPGWMRSWSGRLKLSFRSG